MEGTASYSPAVKTVEKIKGLRDKYGEEKILAIQTNKMPLEMLEEGFINANEISLDFLLNESEFIARYNAEYNPEYKQLIPYVAVKNKERYFTVKRLSASGEQRLVDKISLGMGGHINPIDMDTSQGGNIFERAVYRELAEELYMPSGTIKLSFEGLINDTSNSVGKDHLGLLYIASIEPENPNDEIRVNEINKLSGGLSSISEIRAMRSNLETWSQIVYSEVLQRLHP